MDELLKRPKAIRMLRVLVQEGSMNQRTFTFLAQMTPVNSQRLREWMQGAGLVHVQKAKVRSGTSDIEISLTAEGQQLGRLFLTADPILERAKKKAKPVDDE